MRLLLISNSTMAGQAYLDYPKYEIRDFLGSQPVNALFIPYAAVTFSYDEYETKVNERFGEIGHSITGIQHFPCPVEAVEQAQALVIGGGNTWQLVRKLREAQLMPVIREKVLAGMPFIGWSAGSNVACPTLRTTNDMPITDPLGFDTLNLIPFQINPHYIDAHPEGHAGETRQQRIEEFITLNQTTTVVGLREGSILHLEGDLLTLSGNPSARIFRFGSEPTEFNSGSDLSWLIK